MCRGTTILCKTVCSECVTCTCLCACVCLQFSRIWSAFMWIIITLWRFFSLPSLRPHLQQRQIVEEGWRPNFLVLSLSPLSLCFCLFLSAVCLFSLSLSFSLLDSFSLSVSTPFPSVAHLPPWPGPPTFGALGGPRTIAISASVLKRPIMTST